MGAKERRARTCPSEVPTLGFQFGPRSGKHTRIDFFMTLDPMRERGGTRAAAALPRIKIESPSPPSFTEGANRDARWCTVRVPPIPRIKMDDLCSSRPDALGRERRGASGQPDVSMSALPIRVRISVLPPRRGSDRGEAHVSISGLPPGATCCHPLRGFGINRRDRRRNAKTNTGAALPSIHQRPGALPYRGSAAGADRSPRHAARATPFST
jgi:hypothetical protein